jgi:hypothetical protein
VKPFWTIGREREKSHAAKYVRDSTQQSLLFPVIDAALDLNEGHGSSEAFVRVARVAMIDGGASVWQSANDWIRRIGNRHKDVLPLWDELATHANRNVRWRVACCLYLDISEDQSNRLFAILRSDKSKKVRDYSLDRYENRPDKSGRVEKRFDANRFDERVRLGEVRI